MNELRNNNVSNCAISFIILNSAFIILLSACSFQKKITRSAKEIVLDAPALKTAHTGISIYEPETNKYWYDYQGDKYFIPASNTKIPTCYAAMKYLGDSLVGAWVQQKNDSLYYVRPTGDPTFLHPDYPYQPVFDFFKKGRWNGYYFFEWNAIWKTRGLGSGWSWNDYMETYMAERSPFPVYGNLIKFKKGGNPIRAGGITHIPEGGFDPFYSVGEITDLNKFRIERELGTNRFFIVPSDRVFDSSVLTLAEPSRFFQFKYILSSAIHAMPNEFGDLIAGRMQSDADTTIEAENHSWAPIKSRPTDSLLKPMMHRSDNFFAEQSLLMASNEKLGYMSDSKIIDTLLKTDFKDLPQKPRWADGSGLSRYNLFTPQDFVAILNKMKNEFGMERIKTIFPTGGEGTISSYYKTEAGFIYAKTGTLSGVVAFSGFLYTKKNKLLVFSILVNNHQASAADIRRSVEKFLQGVRSKY